MDVAPDAEARVGGGERVVERPGDGPPRAGISPPVGRRRRTSDATAIEPRASSEAYAGGDEGYRGARRSAGRRTSGGRDVVYVPSRRTGPSARGPGARRGRTTPGEGTTTSVRAPGLVAGGARGCGGRASRRCVRRAHPVLAAAVSAVALELHVRLERLEDRAPVSDFHHELVLVRDDVPQARDDAVRPRAPGTTRVGPHRAATPEPEATRGVRDPGGSEWVADAAKSLPYIEPARQRHDILARVMMRMSPRSK